MKVQTISGLIPLLPAVGLPARAVDAADRLGKRFARAARELGGDGREHGRAGAGDSADGRTVLLSVINPDELRRTLEEFFDEAAFLSPHGLRSVSKRYENNPYTLDGVPGRVDRLRAGRVDHEHVRRQLELARPDLDAAQLPRHPPVRASTSASSATTSSSSTRPGSGQQRTFGEIAQDLADRIVSIWLPDADGRRPVYGDTEKLRTTRPGRTT